MLKSYNLESNTNVTYVIIRGGTKSNLEMHVELKHLEITYKCDEECNFQGGYEFNLRMHIKNWYR